MHGGQLVSPCLCKGSLAYVHPDCLAQQIESKSIIEVAEVQMLYNSRCTICKFHIQFVIEQEDFELSSQGISKAFASLNEDSAARLGLNVSLAIIVFTIMTITLMAHLKTGSGGHWSLNCKVACLELFLFYVECLFLKNIVSCFPFKRKKPVPIVPLSK